MQEIFEDFKNKFERRFNSVSILDLGEDSVRYDFFIAFMNNLNLQSHDIQVEYPITPNAYVPNPHNNSKRKENPQIDFFCSNPNKVVSAEFGLFKRNSNLDSNINATEKVFKMLNDMLRLSLNQIFNPNEAYFICVADSKILGAQMRNSILPAFPASNYAFNYNDINEWIRGIRSAKSNFDNRFVEKANALQLSIHAELIFNQRIHNLEQTQLNVSLTEFPASNILETRVLVYKISGIISQKIRAELIQPHDNSAKYHDFVFGRRFGAMYNLLTQNNLSKIKNIAPKGKILDFGAGTGRLSIPLAQANYEVTAVDCSSEMLKELKRKAFELNLNIETHQSLMKVTTNDFDLAISVFTVLAYIKNKNELFEIFSNIFQLLKPSGFFMFDLIDRTPYYNNFNNNNGVNHNRNDDFVTITFQDNDSSLGFYTENVSGTLPGGEAFNYSESFTIKFWTIDEVREIFNQIGFREIEQFCFAGANYFILDKH
jgi:2-polyprenyl-3-methyl-5-hydroxy-6-metoxy-1,4-benzoquinol methylase